MDMENRKMYATRPGLSQYEQIRMDNIRQREEMFRTLNINQAKQELNDTRKAALGMRTVRKRLRAEAEVGERRRSSRVAGVKVAYAEEENGEDEEGRRGKRRRTALVEAGDDWRMEEGAVASRLAERDLEGW